MERFRLLCAFVAVSLLIAAPLFGSVHTLVPHSHAPGTHLHTDLYASLVSVLTRDGVVLPAPSFALLLSVFILALASCVPLYARTRNFALANALKEGRLVYRRFG